METANFNVEKLRGKDNWLQWRFVIRTLLEKDADVINVCEGTLIRLAAGTNHHDSQIRKFLKAVKADRKLIVMAVEMKFQRVEDHKKNLKNLTARLMVEEVRLVNQDDTEELAVALAAKARLSNNPSRQKQHKRARDEIKWLVVTIVEKWVIRGKTVPGVTRVAQKVT